jgi:hypothetical protein
MIAIDNNWGVSGCEDVSSKGMKSEVVVQMRSTNPQ